MKRTYLLLILALTVAMLAADKPLEPGPPGQLQVFIAVSDSPDYIEAWPRVAAGRNAAIPQIKEIDLGRTAYISFIVTGYTLKDRRTPDLAVDVSILQRDGTAFYEKESYARIQDGPAAPKGLLMADPTLELELQPEDLPGTYAIMAVVHDRISGKKAQGGFALLAREPAPDDEKKEEPGGKDAKPPR